MLSSIRLQGFKKFEDTEIHLRPFTLLMGENSSGKTTVLQAINSALILTPGFVTDRGKSIKIKDKGISVFKLPGIDIENSKELFYGAVPRGGVQKGARPILFDLVDEKNNIYKLKITSLFGGLNISCISKLSDLSTSPELHQKMPISISGFIGLLPSEERSFSSAMNEKLRSGKMSSIIRNMLLDTKEKKGERFQKLQERLAKDFNFHLDKIFFNEQRDVNVTASYKEELSDARRISLDLISSGSGFLQILQILAPIYRYCPDESSIVLLDEPDAHLHPNLQIALLNTLRDIQKEFDIQIIVSTHSTSIIRATDPSEVVSVQHTERVNKPLTSTYDVEEQIRNRLDITTYELAKSVISGKLIFFEDKSTSIFEAFDKVLGTQVFSGANTAPILRGRAKDDKVPFRVKEILKEFKDFIGEDIEIHFVRDSDGLNEFWRQELLEYADRNDVTLHLLKRHEIENYLLSFSLIRKALCRKYPDKQIPTEEEISKKIVESLKATIALNRFSFDGNLRDSIQKTARLLNNQDYGNFIKCESEAKKLREQYEESCLTINELLEIGMGKEALKEVRKWLNEDLQFCNFSNDDILRCVEAKDVPSEIGEILSQLKSKTTNSFSLIS